MLPEKIEAKHRVFYVRDEWNKLYVSSFPKAYSIGAINKALKGLKLESLDEHGTKYLPSGESTWIVAYRLPFWGRKKTLEKVRKALSEYQSYV